ncbi:MAG TPA: LysR family transcriptional regulator [Bacillota bacterium]|nr:LysR family transcriptional regulator [Bacillota bacterium]
MDINFELYKIFYHAAKSQSFSRAAAELFISQSAVSQAIKNLETKLGGALFFRKNQRLKLTPEGELLLLHIEQAYHLMKTAERKLEDIHNLDAGEIRIGASDTVCKYFLLPYLKDFHNQFPQIQIRLLNRTSEQLVATLKNGLIDFAIVTLPQTEPGLEVLSFKKVTDIFVASEKYSNLKKIKLSWLDFSRYPVLMLEKTSATRCNLEAFLRQKGIIIQPEIELESVDLLVDFARCGFGIAHVLKESAVDCIEKGQLFEIVTQETLPDRELGLVCYPKLPPSGTAQKLIERLV